MNRSGLTAQSLWLSCVGYYLAYLCYKTALRYFLFFRTRSRSGKNGTVLGSKKPRQGLPFFYGPYKIQKTESLSPKILFLYNTINKIMDNIANKYLYTISRCSAYSFVYFHRLHLDNANLR